MAKIEDVKPEATATQAESRHFDRVEALPREKPPLIRRVWGEAGLTAGAETGVGLHDVFSSNRTVIYATVFGRARIGDAWRVETLDGELWVFAP